MHEKPRIVSGVEVIPLCDAVGPMGESIRRPLEETFPDADPKLWKRVRERSPGAFDPDGGWLMHFHCFLLRVPLGPTVLVDTGVGTADSPASSWAPVPGALPGTLEEIGVSPDDVDTVVLTHLHSDHASGAVTDGKPMFPNARHLVQEAEVEWLEGAVLDEVLQPLKDGGLLEVTRGEERLADEIVVVPSPGHTPGHQSVVVGEDRLLVAGDLVLHPLQIDDPSVTYVYDEDAGQAADSRTRLLERLRTAGGVLAAPHLPEPFVEV